MYFWDDIEHKMTRKIGFLINLYQYQSYNGKGRGQGVAVELTSDEGAPQCVCGQRAGHGAGPRDLCHRGAAARPCRPAPARADPPPPHPPPRHQQQLPGPGHGRRGQHPAALLPDRWDAPIPLDHGESEIVKEG